MYRSIAVPLDGSALGHRALKVAVPLACGASATLHLVQVRTGAPQKPSEYPSEEPESAYLNAIAREVGAKTGLTVNVDIIQDPLSVVLSSRRPNRTIAEALRQYVRDHRAELVVMSSHGRGGFRRAWMGSVADALVRDCPVPVMVVKPHGIASAIASGAFRLDRILLPLDGSAAAETAIKAALELATPGRAHVTLFYALEPLRQPANPYVHWVLPSIDRLLDEERLRAWEYLEKIESRLRSESLDVELEVVLAAPATGILHAAKVHHSDIIVIATHGAGGATRLLLGSVADKVVRSAPVPVLVVHSAVGMADTEDPHLPVPLALAEERC